MMLQRLLALALLIVALLSAALVAAQDEPETVRFATFNASLNRSEAGELIADLSSPDNEQAQAVAAIIQTIRPDVLLINEFDYDEDGEALQLFQDNYLGVAQGELEPIIYEFSYNAPSNTGVPSELDFDNDGEATGIANDAYGFGFFPGQFGMVVLSQYPIDIDNARTFQNFVWGDMPDALLPDDPETDEPADFYDAEELAVFRLSSKSHWDLPIMIDDTTVHFLVSHPTPPVFDGPEDRNGTRNFDEIRFWADYISGEDYFYDDAGVSGGLAADAPFVIAGDMNSDPFDGDSIPGAAQLLLDNPRVNTAVTPSSEGGVAAAEAQGGANAEHESDPQFDTADFGDETPGNLRADYVLPSVELEIVDAVVVWPLEGEPLRDETELASDHRPVYIDVTLPAGE